MAAKLETIEKVAEERNRRYEDKFRGSDTAVAAALAASKELTSAAFASSEKAIIKAEEAQRESNAKSNEFRGQLSDQASTFMPRLEAESRINALAEKVDDNKNDALKAINDLNKSRDVTLGGAASRHDSQIKTQWAITLAVSIFFALLGIAIGFLVRGAK